MLPWAHCVPGTHEAAASGAGLREPQPWGAQEMGLQGAQGCWPLGSVRLNPSICVWVRVEGTAVITPSFPWAGERVPRNRARERRPCILSRNAGGQGGGATGIPEEQGRSSGSPVSAGKDVRVSVCPPLPEAGRGLCRPSSCPPFSGRCPPAFHNTPPTLHPHTTLPLPPPLSRQNCPVLPAGPWPLPSPSMSGV